MSPRRPSRVAAAEQLQRPAGDQAPRCFRCNDGHAIPGHFGDILYFEGEDKWIEVVWQDGPDVVGGQQLASFIMCRRPVPVAECPDAYETRYSYVAQLRSNIWRGGNDPDAVPEDQAPRLPKQFIVLSEDAPSTFSRSQLWSFAHRAMARLCDLSAAGDERVLAHFPMQRGSEYWPTQPC